jgi:hypothetical protein
MTERGFSFVRSSTASRPFAYDPETSAKALPPEVAPEFGAISPTRGPLLVQPRKPGFK